MARRSTCSVPVVTDMRRATITSRRAIGATAATCYGASLRATSRRRASRFARRREVHQGVIAIAFAHAATWRAVCPAHAIETTPWQRPHGL